MNLHLVWAEQSDGLPHPDLLVAVCTSNSKAWELITKYKADPNKPRCIMKIQKVAANTYN